jgi:hypothetical protein
MRVDMRRVTIKQFKYEPDLKTFVGHVEAVIELSADGVHDISGASHYADVPASDPTTGDRVLLQDDPIRWSELIEATLAYGDVEVEVTEDVETAGGSRSLHADEPSSTALAALSAQIHGLP